MSKETNTPKPILIIVTGRPGAGKTTLAHLLSKKVGCPAICRDELKEGYVNTTNNSGAPGDSIGRDIYYAFFETIELLLGKNITLIAEAAFQHKVWAPKLEELKSVARIKIILCSVDPKLARARHVERGLADSNRTRFHSDQAVHAARKGNTLPLGDYDPPAMDLPTLTVDSTNGYEPKIEEIVSFVLS